MSIRSRDQNVEQTGIHCESGNLISRISFLFCCLLPSSGFFIIMLCVCVQDSEGKTCEDLILSPNFVLLHQSRNGNTHSGSQKQTQHVLSLCLPLFPRCRFPFILMRFSVTRSQKHFRYQEWQLIHSSSRLLRLHQVTYTHIGYDDQTLLSALSNQSVRKYTGGSSCD